MADDPMWCVVMFDLPVGTKKQRREATRFRNLLLDEGYWRAQYSVYVRYSPTVAGENRRVNAIKANLPAGGEVRILYVTDREWARTLCFQNEAPVKVEKEPQQLTIF
ncbi:CRISPR-associated endonuclease Cas2 [Actinomyces sp. 2119]|uniref:CRISPR-associated endoribonuclease Cas2 n=1 Tax=Actinomyces lilanjuaniae TaxID=2321394 RepID=A0ABM6Z1T3_9ACTO|nr:MULTISPECIES: CRISPR-associated endonuclease Cas2 [Actinomyces]AYD89102.1 CRISPR-associated endonuclease Cas2 [Actinomyces lilanjuaniae]RJF41883.1 CRISPR-associated endonuclease Cas2 [Actinomyces sp. 2119]